ncbi:universal stress protein [Mycobacterium sp. NPDC003323]
METSRPDDTPAIVVAVDGSEASAAAVAWAADEALLCSRRLVLAHACPTVIIDTPDPALRDRLQKLRMHHARDYLSDIRSGLTRDTALRAADITIALHLGNPVKILIELSTRAWMLVVGSRFRGSLGGRRIGSVSSALCSRAHCPVAVIHSYDADRAGKPVVVGVDGSPISNHAVTFAFAEAQRRHVGLVAVHAWSDVGVLEILGPEWEDYRRHAHAALTRALAESRLSYPDVTVAERVYCDRPAHWLTESAAEAGLVVVGGHGRGRLSTLIAGSVAVAVAEATVTPVVVVRGT